LISAWAGHDGQRDFRFAFDPEDIAQNFQTPLKGSTRSARPRA
jgi:hypothetical protein